MIRGRNIICVASGYHEPPTGKHHVMRQLARDNNVCWVNFHASRRPQLRMSDLRSACRRLGHVRRGTARTEENIHVVTPPVVPLPGLPAARAFNAASITRNVRHALSQLPAQPVQLWLFTPDVPEIIGRFNEACAIYYCVDEFSEFPGYDAHRIRKLEATTMEKCDVVFATARRLYDDRCDRHPNVHFAPHGVDVEHFAAAMRSDTPVPADIADMPSPVFGYFGLIGEYVDIELIAQLADRRPEWNFALIGDSVIDVSRLSARRNVRLLGRRDYASLPAYARAFDVGLIPFAVNDLTRAVNPIKLREYLAAGLPVVSTPLPEVSAYQPHVCMGEGFVAFERACTDALAAARAVAPADRAAAVQNEGWPARVREISAVVAQTVKRQDRRAAEHRTAAAPIGKSTNFAAAD